MNQLGFFMVQYGEWSSIVHIIGIPLVIMDMMEATVGLVSM